MIYLPKRAVFIHVPRSGGNSITSAIASSCAGKRIDAIIGTAPATKPYWELLNAHITAHNLKPFIDEWDSIFKFAIYRPEQERLESVKKLVQRDINNKTFEHPSCDERWKDILLSDNKEWYWNRFRSQDIDYYTKGPDGEDLGVEIFNLCDLDRIWPEICDRCKIPRCSLSVLNKS
jgi:hypothetical protein